METVGRRQIGGLSFRSWIGGAVGGLAGGIIFGLVIRFWMPEDVILRAIPSLYGFSGPAPSVGWFFHLFHSVLLGLLYAMIANYHAVREHTTDPAKGVVAGAIYGFFMLNFITVIYSVAVFAGVSVPEELPLPYVGMPSYLGFIAFGGVLGVVYALFAAETE